MKNSIERPFGSHGPEERICAFCGDAFVSTHGLQQYCPEKFGKKDYCKLEQKKLLTQKKLLELAQEVAIINNPPIEQLTPLERNIQVLDTILGNNYRVKTNSDQLDAMGFNINIYSRRIIEGKSDYVTLVFGSISLVWKKQNESISTFTIIRL